MIRERPLFTRWNWSSSASLVICLRLTPSEGLLQFGWINQIQGCYILRRLNSNTISQWWSELVHTSCNLYDVTFSKICSRNIASMSLVLKNAKHLVVGRKWQWVINLYIAGRSVTKFVTPTVTAQSSGLETWNFHESKRLFMTPWYMALTSNGP